MADENVQTAPMDSNSQAPDDPVDLAAAFKLVNQANKAAAAAPLAEGETGESNKPEPEPEPEPSSGSEAGEANDTASEGSIAGDEPAVSHGDTGEPSGANTSGTSASMQSFDQDAVIAQYQQLAQQNAINAVAKKFRDNHVKAEWSIQDLYEEDKNTGDITFRNPDNASKPFNSRAEAQAWVDAMNKQIVSRFNSEVNDLQRLYLQQYGPAIQMAAFVNTYNSLDKTTQDILEDLVSGYEINDSQGNTIGYKCDLNAMTKKAMAIAKHIPQQEKKSEDEAKPKPTSPATDMKTGSSDSGSDSFKEPKTIGEAMKMYTNAKKGKKND